MTTITQANLNTQQAALETALVDLNALRWSARSAANDACGVLPASQTAKLRRTEAHLLAALHGAVLAQAEMTDFAASYGGGIVPQFGGDGK